jgi:hypothetical protein
MPTASLLGFGANAGWLPSYVKLPEGNLLIIIVTSKVIDL